MTSDGLTQPTQSSDTGGKTLATGGAILGIAMMLANAGNYLLNVFLGRWLTPAEFADANLMVTILLLVTALAISLQLIAARFAGIQQVDGDVAETDAMAHWLERRALIVGGVLAFFLIAGAPILRDFFNNESAIPFAVLGVGMPFYLIQAVGRGVLQGQLAFKGLAATFVVEMLVRVVCGVALVAIGLGVTGATLGLGASFVATWAHVRYLNRRRVVGQIKPETIRNIGIYARPVAILLLGQIIINNGDVLIAKRFLVPETAGVYAAIALAGRAVFFLSWSVATTIFPASAQRSQTGENSSGLLRGGVMIIAALGVVFVAGAWLLGDIVLGNVFGPEYSEVSSPLARYAFATSLFAIANLIASHNLAANRLRESYVLVAGGVFQTVLLISQRGSIDSLVNAQVVAMAVLLAGVAISYFRPAKTSPHVREDHKLSNPPFSSIENTSSTNSEVVL